MYKFEKIRAGTYADRAHGTILGAVLGDALGIPFETMRSEQVIASGGRSLELRASTRSNGETYARGEGSDDTAQLRILLEEARKTDPGQWYVRVGADGPGMNLRVAAALRSWLEGGGKGSGGHTRRVIEHPRFLNSPHVAASQVGVPPSEGNGSLMRTPAIPVIIGQHAASPELYMLSRYYSLLTHGGDATTQACGVLAQTIHMLLKGDADAEIAGMLARLRKPHLSDPRVQHWLEGATADRLVDIDKQGSFVLATLQVGMWALFQSVDDRPRAILTDVICMGGDTDTNASVAGALLGARFGARSLCTEFEEEIEGLLCLHGDDSLFEIVNDVLRKQGAV